MCVMAGLKTMHNLVKITVVIRTDALNIEHDVLGQSFNEDLFKSGSLNFRTSGSARRFGTKKIPNSVLD